MSRRFAREAVMMLQYAKSLGNEDTDCNLDAIYAEKKRSEKDDSYIARMTQGIDQNREQLDELISRYAHHWEVDRIPRVDLAILRVGLYELQWCSDIPPKVTINECVELAKNYSTEKSGSFINGILASYYRQWSAEQEGTDESSID